LQELPEEITKQNKEHIYLCARTGFEQATAWPQDTAKPNVTREAIDFIKSLKAQKRSSFANYIFSMPVGNIS